MTKDDEDVRLIMSSRDLDDYDIMHVGALSAAVPHEMKESFRKLIWSALVTYQLGNTSVDNVIRHYAPMWERYRQKAPQQKPHVLALRSMMSIVDELAGELERVDVGGSLGRICAKSALCRLEATFKAAYGLIRKEYVFESEAVIRLSLEQLAWACAVYDAKDEKVFSTSPTKSIVFLKRYLPNAGALYKQLSEGAHIDPALARNYLRFHNGGIPPVRRSEENAIASGRTLILLSVVYLEMVQALFSPVTEPRYNEWHSALAGLRDAYEPSSVQ